MPFTTEVKALIKAAVHLSVCPSVCPMSLAQKRCILELWFYRTLIGSPMVQVKHISQHGHVANRSGQNALGRKTYTYTYIHHTY